ncbi:MAG: CDP-4-keto-6-deoxy-D-glucose-3-dehydrase, partial [Verrucomicrobia bacterium]|nr:CDP-4-keto-6-deoxy-D-glucose-3-dehydrase [Verrucomicrobiota bacterium]
MRNNILRQDLDAVVQYLQQEDPILTQSAQVRAFEQEWSAWLGVDYSVFVNSGSSANLITMAALRMAKGAGEVIVPTLTWVSDIASVLQAGLEPVFVDINPQTLGMDTAEVLRRITPRTRAVFITHVLGYNALTRELVNELEARRIPIIEDVCESHGAVFEGRRLGSIGWISNFSFYYAHHLSTIEGGMACTNDPDVYETLRMLRSHGMARESTSASLRQRLQDAHPDLNPDFIFAFPAYNVRSTEINAIMGRSQLKRLDANNERRTANLLLFLENLDPGRYQVEFATEGSSNYAFTLILKEKDESLRDRVMKTLRAHGVEFRRGTSGGGNQLRQPYLKKIYGEREALRYPKVDHVHFFGFYIGNYP